ncbi:hypothetical protein [Bradyrhizobium japonicum]|uniref:hypothetical protein n=1 Tax=Bradyrhizobium japonicum TaxID=375 RepID=UPI0018AD3552|nr:hypothetical protein [Bradyrhizobium japonicum]
MPIFQGPSFLNFPGGVMSGEVASSRFGGSNSTLSSASAGTGDDATVPRSSKNPDMRAMCDIRPSPLIPRAIYLDRAFMDASHFRIAFHTKQTRRNSKIKTLGLQRKQKLLAPSAERRDALLEDPGCAAAHLPPLSGFPAGKVCGM